MRNTPSTVSSPFFGASPKASFDEAACILAQFSGRAMTIVINGHRFSYSMSIVPRYLAISVLTVSLP